MMTRVREGRGKLPEGVGLTKRIIVLVTPGEYASISKLARESTYSATVRALVLEALKARGVL